MYGKPQLLFYRTASMITKSREYVIDSEGWVVYLFDQVKYIDWQLITDLISAGTGDG